MPFGNARVEALAEPSLFKIEVTLFKLVKVAFIKLSLFRPRLCEHWGDVEGTAHSSLHEIEVVSGLVDVQREALISEAKPEKSSEAELLYCDHF